MKKSLLVIFLLFFLDGCFHTSSYRLIEYRGDSGFYSTTVDAGIVPGLGGFNLEFTNSDHHINYLEVGGLTSDGSLIGFDSFVLGIVDNDSLSILGSSDSTYLWAKYIPIGPGPTFLVSGEGIGTETVTVDIPHFSEDELFFLRGFSFRSRPVGANHHIRRIAVRHNRDRDSISVTFHDDSAEDDSFKFSVSYSVVFHANRTGRTGSRYFEGPFSQDFNFTNSASITKVVPGLSILSGFDFQFDDRDHHLRKIAIDPSSLATFQVTYTDDERDNAVTGFIEYITLQHTLR